MSESASDSAQEALEAQADLKMMTDYKQMFEMFDTDGSGSIDKEELAAAVRNVGLNFTRKELEEIIVEVDKDGDGEIDFDEFVEVIQQLRVVSLSWSDVVKQCFDIFDKSHSGQVHRDDFVAILKHVGNIHDSQLAQRLFDEYDVDGSDMLSYNEFYEFVRDYLTEDDL